MSERRRAAVTGLGAVTPLGATFEATRVSLAEDRSALSPATLLDASPFAQRLAGEIRDVDPRRFFRVPKAMKLTDRRTRWAIAASAMALASSGLEPTPGARERLGVLLATTGSDLSAEDLGRALARDGDVRSAHDVPFFAERVLGGLSPLWLLVNLPNMASAHVAIQLEGRGPNSTVMTGISGGLQAIGEAAAWIARGDADAAVAGGADAPVHPYAWAAFEQAGLFADGEESRDGGFVPGEGAAVCLLEEEGSARERGARVHGVVLGLGSAAGAPLHPEPLLRAVRAALCAAGLEPSAVRGLALTVPSTGRLPAQARAAVADVVGPLEPFPASTSRTGHLLAASAALDALLSLGRGRGPVLAACLGYSGDAAALVLEAKAEEAGS